PTHTNNSLLTRQNIPVSCHKHTTQTTRSPGQVLNWPKKTRGLLLGSFYWGYPLTQIASSIAVTYFGPKRFLALLIFMSSLATLLLPVISTWSSPFIVLLRIIAGAAQV
ncbi:unnamed protein product, partial [Adineta steineri]